MAAAYTDVTVVITDFSVGTVSILNMKFYGKLDFVPNEDTGLNLFIKESIENEMHQISYILFKSILISIL